MSLVSSEMSTPVTAQVMKSDATLVWNSIHPTPEMKMVPAINTWLFLQVLGIGIFQGCPLL